MSISRRQKKIGGSILTITALVIVTGMGFASHAEYKLSEHIQKTAQLGMTLYAAVGEQVYLSSSITGEWGSVTLRIRDVGVSDFGLVSLEYGASNIKIPASPVLSDDSPELPTKQYFAKLSPDGVSLGNKLGLTDLSIQSLKDSSPIGDWETEVIFETMPAGWQGKTQVSAKLRIVSRGVIITPMGIISAPSSPTDSEIHNKPEFSEVDAQHILGAFRLTLRDSEIPVGILTTRAYVSGGPITTEGEQVQCTVSPTNFILPTSQQDAETSAKSTEKLSEKNCRVRR